jgi:hypothetical protein
MTAVEVIDQIKTLDPQERIKVLNLLLEMETPQKDNLIDQSSFKKSMDQVFSRHSDLMRKLAQ